MDIKLLIVDDDQETIELMYEALKKRIGKTVTATSAKTALELIKEHKPDIVVTDIKMPGMDGIEMAKIIQKEHPDTKLAIVSAFGEREHLLKIIDLGIDLFFTKPIKMQLLIDKLEEEARRLTNLNNIKKLKKDYENEHERFELAIRGSRDGIFDWNLKTDEMFHSERFETMLGYEPGELPQTIDAWKNLLHPEDKEESLKKVDEYLKLKNSTEPFEIVFRMKTKQGAYRWIMGRGHATFSEDGTPLRFVGFNTDITDMIKQQEKLDYSSKHDPLTDLPNRLLLNDVANQMLKSADRYGECVSVLYLDLDGFKDINDTYGHKVGDYILVEVSKRLKRLVRESDVVARIGGDEFLLITNHFTEENVLLPFIERLLIDFQNPFFYRDLELKLSISIGVSIYSTENNVGIDALIRQADQAMYEAKNNGKNGYVFFNPSNQLSKSQEAFIKEFSSALENKELALHYQPQIQFSSGNTVGVEALVRWEHPEKGLLYPNSFLPKVYKHTNIIHQMSRYVLYEAFSKLQSLKESNYHIKISINPTSNDFLHHDFIDYLNELFEKFSLVQPDDIEFEILESTLITKFESLQSVLNELQSMGIGIALDDFGTGYSTLHYLKQLSVNKIKIDTSFVADCLYESGSLAIIDASIALANSFEYDTLAEGIENYEQAEVVSQLGCKKAQGYFYSKPIPYNELILFLQSKNHPSMDTQVSDSYANKHTILYAIVEHNSWMRKFKKAHEANNDSYPELDHKNCHLGRWIHNQLDEQCKQNPTVQQLDKKHTLFHSLAMQLLSEKKNADALMQSLREAHEDVIKYLKELQKAGLDCVNNLNHAGFRNRYEKK